MVYFKDHIYVLCNLVKSKIVTSVLFIKDVSFWNLISVGN